MTAIPEQQHARGSVQCAKAFRNNGHTQSRYGMKIKDQYITIMMQQLDDGMKGNTTDRDREIMLEWITDVQDHAEQILKLVNRKALAKIVDGKVEVV